MHDQWVRSGLYKFLALGALQAAFRSRVDILEHHLGELVVRDLTVAIFVDLLDDRIDDRLVEGLTEGQHLLDLVGRDGAAAVLVKHLERGLQLVAAKEVLLVHRCNDELGVLDLTIAILINAGKHLVNLFVRKRFAEEFGIAELDLLLGELAVTVDIHGAEDLVDLLLLLLGKQLGGDESVGGLLQLGRRVEILEVV